MSFIFEAVQRNSLTICHLLQKNPLHRLHQRQHGWFIKKIDYFLNVSSHHFRVHRRHIENQVILYAKYMYLLKVNAFENVSKYIFNHLINVSIYTFLYSNWLCKNEQKYFHDFIIHYLIAQAYDRVYMYMCIQ